VRRFSAALFAALFFGLSFFVTSFGYSQTSSPVWYTLNAPEGSVITASAPITLRYGQVASTCSYAGDPGPCYGLPVGSPSPAAWTTPITFSPPAGSSTVTVTVSTATFGEDPLPGVVKTVQIEEESSPQTITVNGQTVTVPATSSVVWYTLDAPEGSAVTASAPITLRYGQVASTCAYTGDPGPCYGLPVGSPSPEAWTAPITFSPPAGSSTVTVTVSTATFGEDPLPGVAKTAQIEEESSTQTITVNGQTVTVPALGSSTCLLTPSPSVITFQSTTVGYTLSSSASLTNNCSSTINVSSIQITGPYSVSGVQTSFSVAPGQSQSYTVVFAPTAAGTDDGSVTFVDSDNSSVSVTLNGTGVAAAATSSLSASPTSLSFGSIAVNSSTSLTLTVTNSGSASTSISSIAVSGAGFAFSGATTPLTLAANQSQKLTVTFSPTASGNASGSLTITSSGSTLTVPLSGTGTTSTATTYSVDLSWTASTSQVSGYNVYRSTTSGSGYALLNSSPIATASYTDPTVAAGTTYYYVVTSVSASGVESSSSNQVSVTVP
jgi:Abnormal spindle-like microcephaly-assoc'd, ASPM-SPD-2-Hydin